jgi:hypothetical protein
VSVEDVGEDLEVEADRGRYDQLRAVRGQASAWEEEPWEEPERNVVRRQPDENRFGHQEDFRRGESIVVGGQPSVSQGPAEPQLFDLHDKPGMRTVQPDGIATNTYHYCCDDPPRRVPGDGDHRVYPHDQFQNPAQLQNFYFRHYANDKDPFLVLIDDRTRNSAKTIRDTVPEWTSWQVRQMMDGWDRKRHILFLDFGYQTRSRLAAEGRWVVLERRDNSLLPVLPTRNPPIPPVQDWSEGIRQLEEEYGMIVWQMTIKSEFAFVIKKKSILI